MITLIVRPADHADLPSLLDICIHRNPEPAGLGRKLADVRPESGMPSNMQGVCIG